MTAQSNRMVSDLTGLSDDELAGLDFPETEVAEPAVSTPETAQDQDPLTQFLREQMQATSPQQKEENRRNILGPAAQFVSGALDTASSALSGAPAVEKATLEPAEFAARAEQLLESGVTPEEVPEFLGADPSDPQTPFDVISEQFEGGLDPKTPFQESVQEAASTAGEFVAGSLLLPGGASGQQALTAAQHGVGFSLGSQLAKARDFGQVGQFVAGIAGILGTGAGIRGGQTLLKKAENLNFVRSLMGKPPIKTVTPGFAVDVGEKGLASVKLDKNPKKTLAKFSDKLIDDFQEVSAGRGKRSFNDKLEFDALAAEESLIGSAKKAKAESIYPREFTKAEAGAEIQQIVNENFQAYKDQYDQLYGIADQIASKINVTPGRFVETTNPLLKSLNKTLLETPPEAAVRKPLKNVVDTLQEITKNKEAAAKFVPELKTVKADGLAGQLGQTKQVWTQPPKGKTSLKLDRLTATKRSLAALRDSESIEPSVKKLLEKPIAALKEDIIEGFGSNKEGLDAFQSAEQLFGETAETYRSPQMVKLRSTDDPESILNGLTKESQLNRVKEAVGDAPEFQDMIDRVVVEEIAGKSTDAARQAQKQVKKAISKNANDVLTDLIDSGDRITKAGAVEAATKTMLREINEAVEVGKKPTQTLNNMKNPKGYDLVRSNLKQSPNGKKIWKTLVDESAREIVDAVIDDSGVNFKKAKNFTSDPHVRRILRDAYGEKGEKFLQQIDVFGKNITDNLKALSNETSPSVQSFFESALDKSSVKILTGLAPFTSGASLIPLGAVAGKRAFTRAQLRRVLADKSTISAMERFAKATGAKERVNALKEYMEAFDKLPFEEFTQP